MNKELFLRCWKVVHNEDGELWSFPTRRPDLAIRYLSKMWVWPRLSGTPLFCFREQKFAEEWVWLGSNMRLEIWETEAIRHEIFGDVGPVIIGRVTDYETCIIRAFWHSFDEVRPFVFGTLTPKIAGETVELVTPPVGTIAVKAVKLTRKVWP